MLPTEQNRDTRRDLDELESFPSVTKLRATHADGADLRAPEPTTQTGLQAPRLSKPVPSRALPRPRLPIPSVPPRASLALPEEIVEPATQLRHAATRPSVAPALAITPAMSPILPPPMAPWEVQERTAILVLPPIDPTPPPEVAIRTPFAMVVPSEDRDTRVPVLAPPRPVPLAAVVLGQRLPLSRVALIVGATLFVAASVVVGLRPRHATFAATLPAEPVIRLPAPILPTNVVLAPIAPPEASLSAPRPVAAGHPPARHGAPRVRPRIPARRDQ